MTGANRFEDSQEDQFPTLYPWLCLLRMTLMMSLHVVFLLTPEIHLVTSSTMTGSSTAASSVSLFPDNCWLELDNWLECLIIPTDDECFPSSFLDSDLLRKSLGAFGSVLCRVRWLYALLLSTSMITFILITECHRSYDDLMITPHSQIAWLSLSPHSSDLGEAGITTYHV